MAKARARRGNKPGADSSNSSRTSKRPTADSTLTWRGAAHSAEIEYALGNLATNTHYVWEEGDFTLSQLMESDFANFIKTGDPNGAGLPKWPAYAPEEGFKIMKLNVESGAVPEARPR